MRAGMACWSALRPAEFWSGLGQIQAKQTATHFDTHVKEYIPYLLYPQQVLLYWRSLAVGFI